MKNKEKKQKLNDHKPKVEFMSSKNNFNTDKNPDKYNVINKKHELRIQQKADLKKVKQENITHKKNIIREYKTKIKIAKKAKNLKNIYKAKLIKKTELNNAKQNLFQILHHSKAKNSEEIKNLKLELINKKYPLFTEKDKSNRLLLEKIKNKKSENIKKEKTNWKKVFKELPLRMFKEIRRVQWGSADAKIGWKFVSVILFIIVCALFIFGVETALTALLKLLKISSI